MLKITSTTSEWKIINAFLGTTSNSLGLATQTGWNSSILQHCYYSGLAKQIKDIMGTQGKPTTLEAMKTLAHSIDICHWEHVQEEFYSGSDKTNNNNNTINNKSKRKSISDKPANNNNKNQSKGFSSSSNSNDKSKSIPNPLSDKLGKDGKLTPQERQHQFNNQLCLFCGGAGHTAKECLKVSSSASEVKGRSAQATESSQKELDDSKK